jgi:hypothetical protein
MRLRQRAITNQKPDDARRSIVMTNVPSRLASRISSGIKHFQPIVAAARSRDVNESDTVTIVTDMLHGIFGYDKYADITSEHAIRGTYCDLAVKVDGSIAMLIEVKAIGLDLKDQFVKQAVDYAANEGIEWVVLTNAVLWRIYRVSFGKPIDHEQVFQFALSDLNAKDEDDVELLWLLVKEGWQKARLGEYHARCQVLSRFTFGALLLSEPILDTLRREVRRVAPGIKVQNEQISQILAQDVLKRDVLEGERAADAKRLVAKATKRVKRDVVAQKDEGDFHGGAATDAPGGEPTSD